MALHDINDDELLVLDGRCRFRLQIEVDRVKRVRDLLKGSTPMWLSKIIANAEAEGLLAEHHTRGDSCACCGNPGSTRPLYVRGPKRGLPNPNKKVQYHYGENVAGVNFCPNCYIKFLEHEFLSLDFTRFENHITAHGAKKAETEVRKERKRICPQCKQASWEYDINFHNLVHKERFSIRSKDRCPLCDWVNSIGASGYFADSEEWRLVRAEELTERERLTVRREDAASLAVAHVLEADDGS